MTNETGSDDPSTETDAQPLSQPPVSPSAPLKGALGDNGKRKTNDTKNEADELAREFRAAEKWVIGTNVMLAIIGIVALCIYNGQLKVMRGQLGEIIKQYPELQKSANAARDNVTQSEKSLNATIEQFHLDQRAWVSTVETIGKPEIGKALDIKVRARNSGKTFAKTFHMVLVDEPVKEGDHPHFASNEAAFSKNIVSVSLLAPGAEYFATVRASREKLTQPDMDVITSGKTKIYVYGRIEYSDIFGCQHWTQFCTKLRSSGDGEYESCETHNDADDNRCPVTKQP